MRKSMSIALELSEQRGELATVTGTLNSAAAAGYRTFDRRRQPCRHADPRDSLGGDSVPRRSSERGRV